MSTIFLDSIPSDVAVCSCVTEKGIGVRQYGTENEPPRKVVIGSFRRWPLYVVSPETGCWNWLGRIDRYGYGRHWMFGKDVRAHRWMLQLHGVAVDPLLQVDHLCRNRACVNPKHLDLVTNTENQRRAPRTRLNIETAQEIRRRRQAGESNKAIAADFALSQSVVSSIGTGKSWRLE